LSAWQRRLLASSCNAALRREFFDRDVAVLAICALGPDGIGALDGCLRGLEQAPDDLVFLAIGNMGPDAARAAPAILEAIEGDTAADVPERAVVALGRIRNPVAVPRLIELLPEAHFMRARAIIDALAEIGPESADIVPLLIRLNRTGFTTINALGRIAPHDPEVVVALQDAFFADRPGLTDEAWTWLRTGPARADTIATLRTRLHSTDADQRARAAWTAGIVITDEPSLARDLASALDDEDALVRYAVAHVLAGVKDMPPQAAARLREAAANDPDPVVRAVAASRE
ncbi:MAG: HEAT repeat domain-containing protein, partial [Phycisphaerales bacterium]|nr:HEAT repeat domain-containing protein [Phycisphaerales bacterium]